MNLKINFLEDILKLKEILKFYANLKYSHKMGFPPECQWLAEDGLKIINNWAELLLVE